MKMIQYYKKRTLVLLTLAVLVFSNNAFAQGPNAPEAASFEPVDATDMVNLITGDLSYVMPLLNVPSPEGGYPLALSYHGGIAMGQEASWVGLGWNLNPGAISRGVNGEPDDWNNGKQLNFIYSNLGSNEEIKIGVGANFKIFNAGIDYTFINGKASGGTISFGIGVKGSNSSLSGGSFSLGTSVGFGGKHGVSFNAKINNISIGMSSKGANISYYGLSYNTAKGLSISGKGLGVSLTSDSFGFSLGRFGINTVNSNQITSSDVSIRSKGFGIAIPINKFFHVKFSYMKSNASVFDSENNSVYGSLYSKNGSYSYVDGNQDINNLSVERRYMDVLGAFMNGKHPTTDLYYHANPQFLNYDDYNVSGQGVLKKIQPFVYEFGTLNGNSVVSKPSGRNVYVDDPFEKRIGQQDDNIYFYDTVNEDSFLKVNNSDWNIPPSLNEITDITTDEVLFSNFGGENGYDVNSKRRRGGTFIETYTNSQIRGNPSLIYEASNFERYTINNQGFVEYNYPSTGIGAFKVTVLDGKTYHYSLPVYHYENITRGYDALKGEDNRFNEVQRLTPYATHWLLTAITGPDFVDKNSNGTIDEEDYGYWVTFDYGRWTDSFMWDREAKDNNRVTGRVNRFEDEEQNIVKSFGIKQLYYLNAVNTRTHSAIFLKSLRSDNTVESLSKSWTYDDVNKSVLINDSQLSTGIYFTDADFTYNANVSGSPSLKLDKILLVDRDNLGNFNLNHTQTPTTNSVPNRINMHVTALKYSIIQYLGEINEDLYDRQWLSGNFENNVYLSSNYSQSFINQNALNSIYFDYSYALARESGKPTGKLTLNRVFNRGKNNVNLIPPYKFSYYNNGHAYTDNDFDLWGYYKNDPKNWSLKRIESPTGNRLEIKYENDDFKTTLMNVNKLSNYRMTPVPRSFERLNNGLKGKFKLINTNPCYEIGEIYSCLVLNGDIDLSFIKSGHATLDTQGEITAIYDDYIEVDFQAPIPAHFSGAFYLNNHNGGSSKYIVDISVEDCGSEQAIGKCNDSRGGIRVSETSNYGFDGGVIRTKYDYTNPATGESSGMTSQTPYVSFPYLTGIIPGPGVQYEYVTVSKMNGSDEADRSVYNFNTLQPLGYEVGSVLCNGCQSSHQDKVIENIGDFLKVEYDKNLVNTDIQNNYYDEDKINLLDVKIYNNYALLGTLKEKWDLNSKGHILNHEIHDYGNSPFADKLGTSSESFKTYQVYRTNLASQNIPSRAEFFLTKTSVTKNNSVIKRMVKTNGSYTSTFNISKLDFLTGQVLETIDEDSKGNTFKTETTPAYMISNYNPATGYGMGSKVDDITNKNMLTQQAMNKTYLDVDGQWQETSVGITTWNNHWTYSDNGLGVSDPENEAASEKIWRQHKSFNWAGEINPNGTLLNFNSLTDDNFDWGVNTNSQANPKWRNVSTNIKYDHHSMILEMEDINNNYTAVKMGDIDSKVLLTTNSRYYESFYTGAEYDPPTEVTGYLDKQIAGNSSMRTTEKAHTGNYSIKIPSGNNSLRAILKQDEHDIGQYKLSVWVHKDNYQSIRFIPSNPVFPPETFNGEIVFAGNWVLRNHYFFVPNPSVDYQAILTSAGGNVFIDDLRVHPVESSISSYVYNEWDELSYILDSNNLGAHFIYDEAGRLKETHTEVVDDDENNIIGGFKLSTKNHYNYKNQ